MSLRQEQIPTPSSVAANTDALIHFPAGIAIHMIWLAISEATNAVTLQSGNLLGDVQCILGSKTQRQVTGVQLNHVNSCNDKDLAVKTTGVVGNAGFSTIIPICFAEPSRKDTKEARAGAWSLNGPGINGLDVKVRLGNLTNPVLTGWYEYEPSSAPIGSIAKYSRRSYGAVGTTLEDTAIDGVDFYQAMHFFPTTDGKYVNQLDFRVNGEYYRKEITQIQNINTLIGRGMNPDVNNPAVFDCIFDYDDAVGEWLLAQGQKLRFKATLNAATANNMDVVTVRVGPPD